MLSYSIIFKSEKMSRKRVANFSSSGYGYTDKDFLRLHLQNLREYTPVEFLSFGEPSCSPRMFSSR